jgi:hypothetical protein
VGADPAAVAAARSGEPVPGSRARVSQRNQFHDRELQCRRGGNLQRQEQPWRESYDFWIYVQLQRQRCSRLDRFSE